MSDTQDSRLFVVQSNSDSGSMMKSSGTDFVCLLYTVQEMMWPALEASSYYFIREIQPPEMRYL